MPLPSVRTLGTVNPDTMTRVARLVDTSPSDATLGDAALSDATQSDTTQSDTTLSDTTLSPRQQAL